MPSSSSPALATKEHVAFCFDTLSSNFTGTPSEPSFQPFTTALFVTWNKIERGGRERLRGCIGTLEPKALPKALRDYALTSALHDRRFPAITADEVPQLSCTVSFLHSFEHAADWSDWTVGTHGLIIKFTDPGTRTRRSATFLPEVAHSEGWGLYETIEHLVLKAGFNGHTEDVLTALEVTRYQSSASSLKYSEYFSLRNGSKTQQGSASGIPVSVPA